MLLSLANYQWRVKVDMISLNNIFANWILNAC